MRAMLAYDPLIVVMVTATPAREGREQRDTMSATVIPTLDQIADITGGTIARDGQSVIVGYGPLGYLRVSPAYVIIDGAERPAARIDGRLARRDGTIQTELRATLRAAGIEIR